MRVRESGPVVVGLGVGPPFVCVRRWAQTVRNEKNIRMFWRDNDERTVRSTPEPPPATPYLPTSFPSSRYCRSCDYFSRSANGSSMLCTRSQSALLALSSHKPRRPRHLPLTCRSRPRPTPLPSSNPRASHLTDSILCTPLALSLWFLRNPTSPTSLDWRVVLFHRATVPSDFPTLLDRPSIMTARPTSSTSTSSEASARAPSERFVLVLFHLSLIRAGVGSKGAKGGKALLSLRAFRWQSQHSTRTERMKESKRRIMSTGKEAYQDDLGWTSRGVCRGSEEGSSEKGQTQRGRSAPLSKTNSPSHNPSPTDSSLTLLNCRFFVGVQVRVVQHKQTKQLLALKYINKAKCCKMKAVANIIQERRLLEEVRPSPQLSPGISLRGRLMRGFLGCGAD